MEIWDDKFCYRYLNYQKRKAYYERGKENFCGKRVTLTLLTTLSKTADSEGSPFRKKRQPLQMSRSSELAQKFLSEIGFANIR